MKKYWGIFIFCLISATMSAQDPVYVLRIKADLIDDQGHNLSDVQVTINGEPFEITSRKWTFEFLNDSIYHIEFSKLGYMGKTLVFNTYEAKKSKEFFHFDMILNHLDENVWISYHKVISQVKFDHYQQKFVYDKSMAIKRQREIYNCKL